MPRLRPSTPTETFSCPCGKAGAPEYASSTIPPSRSSSPASTLFEFTGALRRLSILHSSAHRFRPLMIRFAYFDNAGGSLVLGNVAERISIIS